MINTVVPESSKWDNQFCEKTSVMVRHGFQLLLLIEWDHCPYRDSHLAKDWDGFGSVGA